MEQSNENFISKLEHHSALRAKKVIPYVDDGAGNAIMQASEDLSAYYVVKSDNANVHYLGKAKPGTATASASWQIRKVDETSGVSVLFADGNPNFDNVWDNRESLTYV
jgi:hypothetical protein